MYKVLSILILLVCSSLQAQIFKGQIFMQENAAIYLNQVYVTNLSSGQTVLSNYNGEFQIQAVAQDKIRFTSILSERQDLIVTEKQLKNDLNLIKLNPYYYEIEEVIIGWKPSGNLKRDVLSLRMPQDDQAIQSMLGLPKPSRRLEPALEPLANLAGGGLSFNVGSIYEAISGDRKKKQRLYEYERMMKGIQAMKDHFGPDYFTRIKIPSNMVDNFLQFVYSSDNLVHFIETGNIESTKLYIEKYLPIYQKRLRDSNLSKIADDKS